MTEYVANHVPNTQFAPNRMAVHKMNDREAKLIRKCPTHSRACRAHTARSCSTPARKSGRGKDEQRNMEHTQGYCYYRKIY